MPRKGLTYLQQTAIVVATAKGYFRKAGSLKFPHNARNFAAGERLRQSILLFRKDYQTSKGERRAALRQILKELELAQSFYMLFETHQANSSEPDKHQARKRRHQHNEPPPPEELEAIRRLSERYNPKRTSRDNVD